MKSHSSPRVIRITEGGDSGSLISKFGNLNTLKMHKVSSANFEVQTWSFDAQSFKKHKIEDNFYFYEFPFSKKMPAITMTYSLLLGVKVLMSFRPNIIHSNSPYKIGLVGYFIKFLTNSKFVISYHCDYGVRERLQPGTIPRFYQSISASKQIELFCISKVDAILPIRKSIINEKFKKAKSVYVFEHGIDFTKFPKTNKPSNELNISFAGRIEDENYIFDICTIIRELSSQNKFKAVFHILGGGSRLPFLKSNLDGLTNVNIYGPVDHVKVLEIRAVSHVSLNLMGGFSLIEAAYLENLLIAYDTEWHHELIKHNNNGYLFKEGDTASIVRTIKSFEIDKTIQMGKKSKNIALNNHGLDTVNKKKFDIYKRVLNETS
tara:strand:+ start:135418 stop:136548 length:1131 start_codon:yes stop_codon:yes gene_type:complete